MILRQRAAALLFLFYSSLLISLCLAQNPSHSVSSFENLPARLVYFDDTTSVIYFDSVLGKLHVSLDEGKTWKLADGIPEDAGIIMFIEHPFSRKYGFALTEGKTHYRTEDQGKTWRPFDMPLEPSLISKPLSFHANKHGYILYQGTTCESIGWASICHDETYYTKDAFSSDTRLLFMDSSHCQFAHSSATFKPEAHADLIYCVGFDQIAGDHSLSSSRLFSSTDFFETENNLEDLGIGMDARGILSFTIVAKYAVVALKDMSPYSNGELHLYVTLDTQSWAKAQFPHSASAQLKENAYTIVESTTYSLAVDVVLRDVNAVGTLYLSNSDGTYFVEALKDTNRNEMGYVDYEPIYGIDGVGIASIVANADAVQGRRAPKQLQSRITYNEGRDWRPLKAPSTDVDGRHFPCNTQDTEDCSLHLHSVTSPRNRDFERIFSPPAPGILMGVGSVGKTLAPYEECDLFFSTDAGLTWRMARRDAHLYEFGDFGTILVAVNDEEMSDKVSYSLDMGQTWREYQLPFRFRAKALVTLPDSTSQKFILSAQIPRDEQKNNGGRYAIIYLDFSEIRSRKCSDGDFDKWYARPHDSECLMGHKQWYMRRKPDVDCYVGNRFEDPVLYGDSCECTDFDFECDFNYVRHEGKCEPVGPEPIPAGVCKKLEDTYMGSSGWRKIPGNTCRMGKAKDEKVQKKCSEAAPEPGQIIHQTFEFSSTIVQHAYFRGSQTILVRLRDGTIWQSKNEGYTWNQIEKDERFVAFYHHPYSNDRAYLLTSNNYIYTTTDTGRSWNKVNTPNPPNTFRAQVLRFQPTNSDHLIWVGDKYCDTINECHAEAHYSSNNGKKWEFIESYVVNCAWAADIKLQADPTEIICESYSIKRGSQKMLSMDNKLELIEGKDFFKKKQVLFNEVVGFAKFSDYLVVAEMLPSRQSLDLQVSLDGVNFAPGMFPPGMGPDSHAYAVLESSTNSLFLHKTTSEAPFPFWGNILKSNSNGTYFVLSAENVNRDERGYVDFEKMIGLDGIALINVVANPLEAILTGKKALQSKITHNDGGSWNYLRPPRIDSLGNEYPCRSTSCNLHVHGYTERFDPRATYSNPSVVGLIMAVGNVGEELISYSASDTFLSRDGGFNWEEVHKGAHLWKFGDSGSILVMANDKEPTDRVLYSTDQGKSWKEYIFTTEKMRVRIIVTVPSDTSRRFILFGEYPLHNSKAAAVHIDFSQLIGRQCELDPDNPQNDDFELWSPSEEREERCLFGRQTLYHRRLREAQCYIGDQEKIESKILRNCTCTPSDFECEFNYIRNGGGDCVLVPGTQPLDDDPDSQCATGQEYWYERTAYRRVSYSSCNGGDLKYRGKAHPCPDIAGHGALSLWIHSVRWMLRVSLGFGLLIMLVTALLARLRTPSFSTPDDLKV